MSDFAPLLLDRASFMPHGFCLSWNPPLLLLHAVSDLGIGVSYLSIAAAIAVFARKRADLDFPWLSSFFTLVFTLCGLVHISDLAVLWFAEYGVQGVLKTITAVASVATAVVIWRLLPKALSLPTPAALRDMNSKLAAEIEERRQTEFQLRQAKDTAEAANNAKSDFLATMSHELRTPLNAVLGFADILQHKMCGPLNEKQENYISYIINSGTHLLTLINDILDISKVASGRMELAWSSVNISAVVADALAMLSSDARCTQISLTVTVPPDMPLVDGDPLRLKQIVVNLLSNAVKFTPEGGDVRVLVSLAPIVTAAAVTAAPDNSAALKTDAGNAPEHDASLEHDAAVEGAENTHMVLVVEDTGIGMREEDIPRALAMFSQIDPGLTRAYEGIGVGLPISKALVELHGGQLAIHSQPGVGTRVEIRLPIRAALAVANNTAGG